MLMVCGGMGLLRLFGCFRRRDKRQKKRDADTANQPAYQVRTPLLRHCTYQATASSRSLMMKAERTFNGPKR